MQSLFSYYGGKQRIASQIVSLLPSHTVYCEPFCGGAAVLFAKDRPSGNADHYREILNDRDERIVTIYRVLQTQPIALCRRLWATPFSEAEYARAGQIVRTWAAHDDVTRAWAMVIQLNQSFANKLLAGWARNAMSENKAAAWQTRLSRLRAVLRRLSGVYFLCTDALTCIRQWDAPQTCFYCDPPYPGTYQGHYTGYTLADFQALVDTLAQCQGSFVLSNYDQPGAVIPADWTRVEIQTVLSASGKGQVGADRSRKATSAELGNRTRTEVLWIKDRSATIRPDLMPIVKQRAQQLGLFTEQTTDF